MINIICEFKENMCHPRSMQELNQITFNDLFNIDPTFEIMGADRRNRNRIEVNEIGEEIIIIEDDSGFDPTLEVNEDVIIIDDDDDDVFDSNPAMEEVIVINDSDDDDFFTINNDRNFVNAMLQQNNLVVLNDINLWQSSVDREESDDEILVQTWTESSNVGEPVVELPLNNNDMDWLFNELEQFIPTISFENNPHPVSASQMIDDLVDMLDEYEVTYTSL